MKIINKQIGETPYELQQKLIEKSILSRQSCFVGRLDPMARGSMLFLEDDEKKQMNIYLKKSKIYEFEIILGLSTDTDDILGILDTNIQFLDNYDNILNKITSIVDKLKLNGQSIQKYHPYSSYVLKKNGEKKQLWKWKLENKLVYDEIPSKAVVLHDIHIIKYVEHTYIDLLTEFIHRIKKINKIYSFRQDTILFQWENMLNKNLVNRFISIKMEMKVSSGYYIRQFGYDLKKELNYPLLIYDINRTQFIT